MIIVSYNGILFYDIATITEIFVKLSKDPHISVSVQIFQNIHKLLSQYPKTKSLEYCCKLFGIKYKKKNTISDQQNL